MKPFGLFLERKHVHAWEPVSTSERPQQIPYVIGRYCPGCKRYEIPGDKR
jgi:hypothetical protein